MPNAGSDVHNFFLKTCHSCVMGQICPAVTPSSCQLPTIYPCATKQNRAKNIHNVNSIIREHLTRFITPLCDR